MPQERLAREWVPVMVRLTPDMVDAIRDAEKVIGLDLTAYVRRAVWDKLREDGFAPAAQRQDQAVAQ